MRGYPLLNFPMFDAASTFLRAQGYEVVSPAEHDREVGFDETKNSLEGFDLQAAFAWDIQTVLNSDAIALLPGSEESEGARLERKIAEMCGKQVFYFLNGRLYSRNKWRHYKEVTTEASGQGRTQRGAA